MFVKFGVLKFANQRPKHFEKNLKDLIYCFKSIINNIWKQTIKFDAISGNTNLLFLNRAVKKE